MIAIEIVFVVVAVFGQPKGTAGVIAWAVFLMACVAAIVVCEVSQ